MLLRPGGPRQPGLWPPWRSPALPLWPINSLKSQKKSGHPRKHFSAAASFHEVYRLLQTGLLLTDSVFVELVAYFDETMDSIGGY